MDKTLTEQQLIQASLNGDTMAFQALVSRFEVPLMRFLNFRCHNQADAEDIFQETFINVHLYLTSYDNRFAFSTWLFNIASNQVKRKLKNRPEHVTDSDSLEILSHSTSSQANQSGNLWLKLKPILSNQQLDLLWFTYVEELSGNDVAIILEKSLPWVKINLIRTRKKLHKLLAEEDDLSYDGVRGYAHD